MLSDREFVMRAASAQVAPEALQAMNQDPALAGMIEQLVTAQDVEQFAGGGMVGGSTSSVTAKAVFSGIEPEEFAGGEDATTSDGAASSTMQAEERLQAASAERKVSIDLETEVKRLSGREIGLVVRNADGIRDQYGYTE
jgi:hypothetical protein